MWKLHRNAFSLQIPAKFRKFETCIYIQMRNLGYVLAVIAKMKFSKLLNLIWRTVQFASFQFFICSLSWFQTAFNKDLLKKPPFFITAIKSYHNFILFHKDLRLRKFWQWNDGPFLKNEKSTLLGSWFWEMWKVKNFEFCKFVKNGQRYFDFERLRYSKLS